MKKWWIFALGLMAGFIWLLPSTAWAHGEPVIAVNPISVPASGEIRVTGTEMEDGELFVITLEGITTSFSLGEAVVVDEEFEITLTVPADVPPGSYRVQAVAGEETAVADLTVTLGASIADEAAQDQPEPSAESMDLDRPQTTVRTISIVIGALLSLGVGIWLIRH